MSGGPQRKDDPTLPAPWQALYDPGSGFTYYWNPQTNVTTYDRPAGGAATAAPQVAPPPLVVPVDEEATVRRGAGGRKPWAADRWRSSSRPVHHQNSRAFPDVAGLL